MTELRNGLLAELGAALTVPLDSEGSRSIRIRELCGYDEQRVAGTTTSDALRLIDGLCVDGLSVAGLSVAGPPTGTATWMVDAAELTVPERDLVLAALWRWTWTDRISGSLVCASCTEPFDFDFSLSALETGVRESLAQLPSDSGVYTLDSGARFRLPTGRDELAAASTNSPAAERLLFERCVINDAGDETGIEQAMEIVGAGIDAEFEATCPECGAARPARFSIQDYLLSALVSGRSALIVDLHRIALAYHWSLHEILSLTRRQRLACVALLDGELPAFDAEWA